MKFSPLLFSVLLPFCLSAQAADKLVEVEIPVTGIFAPPVGYDNNDNIEVVIETNLPDSCFRLGRTEVTRQGTQFDVHQYGLRSTEGRCAATDPDPIKMDDDVTTVATLGSLAVGKYSVVSKTKDQPAQSADFAVSASKTPDIDARPYANVTNVAVDSVIKPGHLDIEVNGSLQNSCRELVEPIEVQRHGNAIVVLPTQVHVGPANRLCTYMMRPFRRTISVDGLTEGKYLVHVRARDGKSVNHLVEVKQ